MDSSKIDINSLTFGRVIRSNIQPRNVVIQRSAAGGTSNAGLLIERSSRYSNVMGAPLVGIAGTGVSEIRISREKEKKDMQDLNERFASYIEKVRFLEAQNRKISDELERLKLKWGKEANNIKLMYQAEFDEARKLLDNSEKEKQKLQLRVAAIEDQIDILRRKLEEAGSAVGDSHDKVERQIQQLADFEAEVNLIKRRIALLEGDRDINKKTIARIQDCFNRARIDLDNESILHQDAENRRQILEEELEFLKQVHEQELRELAALAYRDTTNENRELWKSEMSTSLREMQQIYDEKIEDMRKEMESFYTMKIQEFRTGATRQNLDNTHSKEEVIRLKSQFSDLQGRLFDIQSKNDLLQREINDILEDKISKEKELQFEIEKLMTEVASLKAEMESITKELQDLLDAKLGLELEIAAYRKLLEGEEDKVGLRQVVDSMFATMTTGLGGYSAFNDRALPKKEYDNAAGNKTSLNSYNTHQVSSSTGQAQQYGGAYGDSTLNINQVVKGDMLAKTTYQRSAKGPIAISESSPDGKYICLENTGRREEHLGNWTIRRNIDGREMPTANLPGDFKMIPGSKVKIFSRGSKPRDASYSDIELYSCATFGQGQNVTTRLCNASGEERATQVQKTVYA